ncbi:topoisomerase DNA-binding C4 zinc finger domain-containing protein [Sporomusa malonica]|uniref:topoisomerase DNA-binding C4 zinc finger domain-containing protein n=1 Tax=Sporomusa malonica TaxID=112901 RepID=UPI001FE8A2C9|nr:topoisomerase DNA-binding C4 zinc finger domain-containing protein [Sporomusa malonica]
MGQQARFAAGLCTKAKGAAIPLKGDYHCPRCRKGVLQLRNGKQGKFWGCSRYPACRASFDDKNDKPDMPPGRQQGQG